MNGVVIHSRNHAIFCGCTLNNSVRNQQHLWSEPTPDLPVWSLSAPVNPSPCVYSDLAPHDRCNEADAQIRWALATCVGQSLRVRSRAWRGFGVNVGQLCQSQIP